jgi:cell wall-associated NlpC family hydrolase
MPDASAPFVMSASAARLIESAVALVGTPYRLGGQSPDTGFDCSGLVSYVAAQNGIALPRTAAQQYGVGRAVDRDDLTAGDLVFFSTIGPGATHVGIVIVSDDELKFVHAPADGASVRIERLSTSYWQRRWVGARRILTD